MFTHCPKNNLNFSIKAEQYHSMSRCNGTEASFLVHQNLTLPVQDALFYKKDIGQSLMYRIVIDYADWAICISLRKQKSSRNRFSPGTARVF